MEMVFVIIFILIGAVAIASIIGFLALVNVIFCIKEELGKVMERINSLTLDLIDLKKDPMNR